MSNPTISQISIAGTVYDIKDATARDHRPYISSQAIKSQQNGIAFNTNNTDDPTIGFANMIYSPFYCKTEPLKGPNNETINDSDFSILSISGAELVRVGALDNWTEVFLESRYFASHANNTTAAWGMQERRCCPPNAGTYYNLHLVDNIAINSTNPVWRPITYSGQTYRVKLIRSTLLIFGSDNPERYGLQTTNNNRWTQ